MRYLDRLIEHCIQAKKLVPDRTFEFTTLEQLPSHGRFIYVIQQIEGDINTTFQQFQKFRSLRTHACAKLNRPSQVLYVGSSRSNIRKRLAQHLGFGHKSTYALHLNQWYQGQYKITIHQYADTLPADVLQLIEDDLADQLQPAFGKSGANNK